MAATIPVTLDGSFVYPIIIDEQFDGLMDAVRAVKPDAATKVCIVTDTNVRELYADSVCALLSSYYKEVSVYAFEAGEEHKNLTSITGLYEELVQRHFSRGDLLVALGGGVVGDMTGFAAATYMRGIDFVQIPTTLLAQVDSSIGGKTGVDFQEYKNMVGAFYMPRLVYINTAVLLTLPERQFSAGMAEVIKYGLIQDAGFFAWLKEKAAELTPEHAGNMEHLIETCCQCKRAVVEEDPTEQGIRAILNFGHTIGHAIEKASGFSLLHGECVAIGMRAAVMLSIRHSGLQETALDEVEQLLRRFSLPLTAEGLEAKTVLAATRSDKKMSAAGIRFVLLRKIGTAVIATDVPEALLLDTVERVLA